LSILPPLWQRRVRRRAGFGRDPERREGKVLVNSWTPTAKFPPNYFGYVVDTQEGDSYAGLIVNETASSVTVRQPLGIEVVVPRSRIVKMQASRLSLMPEGLEEG